MVFGCTRALSPHLSQFWSHSLGSIQCLGDAAQNFETLLYKGEGHQICQQRCFTSWAGASRCCSICLALPMQQWGVTRMRILLPTLWSVWDIHVCSSHGPSSTMLRHRLFSPASCWSRCTLLIKVFPRVWFCSGSVQSIPPLRSPASMACYALPWSFSFKFQL